MDLGRMLMQLVQLIGLVTKLLVLRDPKNNVGHLKKREHTIGAGHFARPLFLNITSAYLPNSLANLTWGRESESF